MNDFKHLCEYFLAIANVQMSDHLLENIKFFYVNIINSPRVFDKIITMEDLLGVLEKRGVLASDDLSQLRYIAQIFLRDFELDKRLAEFEKQYSFNENKTKITLFQNGVAIDKMKKVEKTLKINSQKNHIQDNEKKMNTEQIQRMVCVQLSDNLGPHWKDFARYLNIGETDIDDIQKNSRNLQDKSNKVLKLYFSTTNIKDWDIPLLDALEKIRRRDLKELIGQSLNRI